MATQHGPRAPGRQQLHHYANGRYLTGDSGYAGVPLAAHHNTVLVGGLGQAKEGGGHDAFAQVPYDLLNRIRISAVEVKGNSVLVRGDATAAYDPGLGLTRFVREFRYSPRAGFNITDDLASRKPQLFTSLLHADGNISREGERFFSFDAGGARLVVQVLAPERVSAAVEENLLTAPGRPGSVDKGERQVRGNRLALSTT
ncbi:MAG: heparinase II/III family protein, partial [Pyrinomonadaceae bacterium]